MNRAAVLLGALLLHPGCTAPMSVRPQESTEPVRAEPSATKSASKPATAAVGRPAAALSTFSQKPVSRPVPGKRSLRGTRIVVDAGHGGKDPGARGLSAVSEKTITLALAKELASRLKARGATVTLTRSGDRYVGLDRRAAVADSTRTDLFVSLHADSASRAQASGVGAWIARNALGSSQRAAREVLRSIKAAGLKVRGVQRAGFRVLVGHKRPAVLIECGFLTNQQDAKRLNSAWYRGRMAEAIAAGIEQSVGH